MTFQFFLLQVMQLEGVQGVQETRFWTLCTKYYVGGVKLEVSTNCDPKYVVSHTQVNNPFALEISIVLDHRLLDVPSNNVDSTRVTDWTTGGLW